MAISERHETFLSDDDLDRIASKIAGAEKMTSAEIRLVITEECRTDIKREALRIFKKNRLHKTARRNTMLILVAASKRQFLLYGDRGIHERVGQDFWDEARDAMLNHFKNEKFGDGLCAGIHLIGEKLADIFPYGLYDDNEISNGVAFKN
jgi:uncharacterized membrane protein